MSTEIYTQNFKKYKYSVFQTVRNDIKLDVCSENNIFQVVSLFM